MRYWVNFHKLREELSFSQVLEHFKVNLRSKGDQATGPCPLPNHTGERKTDSFSANLQKGIFQCFSCGAKGNVLDFAILMSGRDLKAGQDLRQTAIELAKAFNLQHVGTEQKTRQVRRDAPDARPKPVEPLKAVPQGSTPEAEAIINAPLPFTLNNLDPTHPYLKDRGIMVETAEQFGLGYCRKGRFAGRIAIPIHDREGKIIAYAGRLVDERAVSAENPKYLFPGTRSQHGVSYEFRKSLILYNAHRVKLPVETLIIVEGFFSVWWLTQNGFPNCVSLMGSSLSEEQAKTIQEMVGDFGHLTVLTDADLPGMRCHDEIRAKLGGATTVSRPDMKIGAQPTDFTREELRALIPKVKPAHREAEKLKQSKEERICSLISEFPCLKSMGLRPETWNPGEFDLQALKFSTGERAAAQFVLSVWNPRTSWKCGRFDVVEATSGVDQGKRNFQRLS